MRLFVLGAGASIDHSQGQLPGAARFVASAVDTIRSDARFTSSKSALQVALQRLYGFDPFESKKHKRLEGINVEELLTLWSLEREIDPTFPSESSFSEVIVETVRRGQKTAPAVRSTYHRFVEETLGPTDSVVTFNWDTFLDPLIPGYKEAGGPAGDGMYRNYQRFCTAEWEQTYAGVGFQEPYTTITQFVSRDDTGGEDRAFIKLHGSVDLLNCANSGCRQYRMPFRPKELVQAAYCGQCHEPLSPYIIPPVQAKPIRTAPYVRRAWSVAARLIQRAKELVVWGYSLPPTDYWAAWLMRQAWFGSCERIIIVNPEVYFRKQSGPRKEFIGRFAPVRHGHGSPQIAICRSYSEFEAGALRLL